MSLNVDRFLADTLKKCQENEVEFKLLKSENLEGCAGCFTDDPLELNSIIDREDWIEILAHETSHMDQYLEESPLWTSEDAEFNIFDSQLLKYASKDAIERAFIAYARLEIDCDQRAVEKIKKYNLNINLENYIKKANCYHQAYYYFHKYHIFYEDGNPPYNNKEVYATFDGEKILDIEDIWCDNKPLELFLIRNNSKL